MSNIIEFRNTLDIPSLAVGSLDGKTIIAPPTQLPTSGIIKMQVCGITLSDRIPNIFDANPYYAFNNTLLSISTASGFTSNIQLPRGLYPTVDVIAQAINSAVEFLWISTANPGIIIDGNIITDVATITLDPTKMKPIYGATFTLDLRKTTTGTDLATTLGFAQANALLISGVAATKFYSTLEVLMDTQGSLCDIQCSLISVRKRNATQVRTLALISFAGKNSPSDNVWPNAGQVSPIMIYEGSRTINYLNFEVKTMTGLPMLFMGGSIHVVVAFLY